MISQIAKKLDVLLSLRYPTVAMLRAFELQQPTVRKGMINTSSIERLGLIEPGKMFLQS